MKKLIIIICFFAVLLGIGFTALYLFYDGTKINEIQLSDFGSGSGIVNQASLYEAAHKEPGRFSYGGCEEFPGGRDSDYISFQIYAKVKTKRISDYCVTVSDFGADAARWLYVDHFYGNNTACTVTMYRKGLSDEAILKALKELELNFCYSFHGKAKYIPFRITDADIEHMDRPD